MQVEKTHQDGQVKFLFCYNVMRQFAKPQLSKKHGGSIAKCIDCHTTFRPCADKKHCCIIDTWNIFNRYQSSLPLTQPSFLLSNQTLTQRRNSCLTTCHATEVYFSSRFLVNVWQDSSCSVCSFTRRLLYNVIIFYVYFSSGLVPQCVWALYWWPLSIGTWQLGGTTINLSINKEAIRISIAYCAQP